MKIPYSLTAAVDVTSRQEQMAFALAIAKERGYGRLKETSIDEARSCVIACYGPSLLDTWETVRDQQRAGLKIVSMSGATRFLYDKGIVADYHVDMDPRPHKVGHLDPPIPGVQYYMASVCPPKTWELLKGQQVTLWHTYSGKDPATGKDTYGWVNDHDPPVNGEPPNIVIHGGSTIGLTAIHLAGTLLGLRHFEIHGMDASRASGQRHAGVHFGKKQEDGTTWTVDRVKYSTSQIMANAAAETITLFQHMPIFAVFHGNGLTQALVRENNLRNACCADESEKIATVRSGRANIYTVPGFNLKFISQFWDIVVDALPPEHLTDLLRVVEECEPLRSRARYNTGSVPIETALLLRALTYHFKPKIVAEVGTFIGTSMRAMVYERTDRDREDGQLQHVFTCDENNDVYDHGSGFVRTYAMTKSTDMFNDMMAQGLAGAVDFFFFDGRIQDADMDLIEGLSHSKTVYAFDDCVGKEKGVVNAALLVKRFPTHMLIPPYGAYEGRSTLAVLVPTDKVS